MKRTARLELRLTPDEQELLAPDGRIAWLAHHFPAEYAQLVADFPRLAPLR